MIALRSLDRESFAMRFGMFYEHHFTEEYSHSSAPEVFLAAVSQRTRYIREGQRDVAPRDLPPTE